MARINWDDVKARPHSLFGQVQYDHLGDTYRGEIEEISFDYNHTYITLGWTAIWYGGKWYMNDSSPTQLETSREGMLEQRRDGGYDFNAFIFRNAKLYPKNHKDNVRREGLKYIPLPPVPQASY